MGEEDVMIDDVKGVIHLLEQKVKEAGIASNEPKYKRKISYLLTLKVLKELLKEMEDEHNSQSN